MASTGDSKARYSRARLAFTLVELLVVIAIIGILVALLLPAVQAAREAARRTQCSNQLKQIGLAVLNFEGSKKALPAGSRTRDFNFGGPYYSTWSVDILPYLENQSLFDLWNPNVGFSDDENSVLRETVVDTYICPSDISDDLRLSPETGPGKNALWAIGSYRANSGQYRGGTGEEYWDEPRIDLISTDLIPTHWQGPMHVTMDNRNRMELAPVELRKITDGTSKTILAGERHTLTHLSRRTFWAYAYTCYNQSGGFAESRTLIADYDKCEAIGGGGIHNCKRSWGSLHPDIVQFVFCDGSMTSVNLNVDMNLFVASSTIQGGEVDDLSSEN